MRWFTVPGAIASLDDRRASAFRIKDGNRLIVAEDHLLRGDLILREMLHAQVGVGDPRSLFLGASDYALGGVFTEARSGAFAVSIRP